MQYVAEPSEAVNTGLWGSRALLGSPHYSGNLDILRRYIPGQECLAARIWTPPVKGPVHFFEFS